MKNTCLYNLSVSVSLTQNSEENTFPLQNSNLVFDLVIFNNKKEATEVRNSHGDIITWKQCIERMVNVSS